MESTNVTLIAVDCTERINNTILSLLECSESIQFGAIKLLSNKKPDNLPDKIEFCECENITNINVYNNFMFLSLYKYVDTSHCLTVQDHARILNPKKWDDNWLYFDYIGSPWPVVPNSYMANDGTRSRVGNGGFSLRSRKLMELPSRMGYYLKEEQGYYNEDGNICCYWKSEFLKNGIKYAPLTVAVEFSYETPMAENLNVIPFGYHRNLPVWPYKE